MKNKIFFLVMLLLSISSVSAVTKKELKQQNKKLNKEVEVLKNVLSKFNQFDDVEQELMSKKYLINKDSKRFAVRIHGFLQDNNLSVYSDADKFNEKVLNVLELCFLEVAKIKGSRYLKQVKKIHIWNLKDKVTFRDDGYLMISEGSTVEGCLLSMLIGPTVR